MMVTDETKEFYLQAMKVDFLTEKWEIEKYMTALMVADAWGKEIELKKRKNRTISLAERYNTE